MSVLIHEPVSVVAVFKNGRVMPAKFLWHGRDIYIDKVGLCWKTSNGEINIWHFSVMAGKTLYELAFDTLELSWRLEKAQA